MTAADVEQLAAGGRLQDAVAAVAQLLPKRNTVAWALESIRRVPAAKGGPEAVIERWLDESSDENRRAAFQAVEQSGMDTPAGCLCFAIFLSGGSLAPPDTQVAPEPESHLCAQVAASAMSMAAVMDPQNATEHLRAILDRGFHLARELKIWEEK